MRQTWKPLRSLQVFQGHIAHTGATVANPIHTNLPTQGLTELDMGMPAQGRGSSTVWCLRPLWQGRKNKWNLPLHVSGFKKGAKTDETDNSTLILTTLLLASQLRIVETLSLTPTNNRNSTFLLRGTTPRDVTWQDFWHGKIVCRKNSSFF